MDVEGKFSETIQSHAKWKKNHRGDPVTLQCFVFIGTISGAAEPAAIFRIVLRLPSVGIQAADQNFGKAEAFCSTAAHFQHPGRHSLFCVPTGGRSSRCGRPRCAENRSGSGAPESCRQGGCLICGCTETVLRRTMPSGRVSSLVYRMVSSRYAFISSNRRSGPQPSMESLFSRKSFR